MSVSFLSQVQDVLLQEKLDGWLLCDFSGRNPIFCHVFSILLKKKSPVSTRRIFYWIPREGEPIKIVHKLEQQIFSSIVGRTFLYVSEKELWNLMSQFSGSVAIEYSSELPHVSFVDGGTVDQLRKHSHATLFSSAVVLQKVFSVLDEWAINSHLEAARILDEIAQKVFQQCLKYHDLFERDLIEFIMDQMAEHNCETKGEPIVASGTNSAYPHYCPVGRGDKISSSILLIDLWCKKRDVGSIYADITRVGVGHSPLEKKIQQSFFIVREAQKRSVSYIQERICKGTCVRGCDVDQMCCDYLVELGFGSSIFHNLGHSIDSDVHGYGANLSSLDNRLLLRNTCYSIEPALYFPGEFGLRLEHNILVQKNGVIITGGVQDHWVSL